MTGLFEKSEYVKKLFGKHFRKELTVEEQNDLDDWLNESEANGNLLLAFSDDGLFDKALEGFFYARCTGSLCPNSATNQ